MTAQAQIEQLLRWFLGVIFVSLVMYISYSYMKFIQSKEYQEYKLFMSEYIVYENRKAELNKIYRELEERIRKFEQVLVQNLLDEELEEISIDILVRAWKIGEGTVLRLYSSGYKTLKDLDNVRYKRYSMPEYIGDVRFSSIVEWVEREKRQRRERLTNEVEKGSHSNTRIGQEIEGSKIDLSRCHDKLKAVCKELSLFEVDLKRYRTVSFMNFFLGRKIRIPYQTVVKAELRNTEDLLKDILDPYPLSTVVASGKKETTEFYNQFLRTKEKYPKGYEGLIVVDEIYPCFHFFMIHEIGMSFSRENRIETIHFGEIERCSKIGNKILLILSEKGRKVIEFRKNAGIVYNYIKTYEDYHE
jgi:hypothetical protein